MKNNLQGTNLAGMSKTRERVENDFYATPRNAIQAICDRMIEPKTILEPACGDGAIVKVLREYFPSAVVDYSDIIDRGIEGTLIKNFLTDDFKKGDYDVIITNPPFSLAKEFIEKAISLEPKYIYMFAKINLLESKGRKSLFETNPPSKVYVFSERVNPLRNGKATDENGKKWSSTMCFAWFEWTKDYHGDIVVKLI